MSKIENSPKNMIFTEEACQVLEACTLESNHCADNVGLASEESNGKCGVQISHANHHDVSSDKMSHVCLTENIKPCKCDENPCDPRTSLDTNPCDGTKVITNCNNALIEKCKTNHSCETTSNEDCSVQDQLFSNIGACKIGGNRSARLDKTKRDGLTRQKLNRNGEERVTIFYKSPTNGSKIVEAKNLRNENQTVQGEQRARREPLLPALRDIPMVQDRKRPVTASRTISRNSGVIQSVPGKESRTLTRSRSMEDITAVLQSNSFGKEDDAKTKYNRGRRVSFEVWLSDKEKEIIQKLNVVQLKKQQELEVVEKRKQQRRRGKSYEEWLNDKTCEGKLKKNGWLTPKLGEKDAVELDRRRASQQRYDKWLHEKEIQALKKEQELLEKVEKKTLEMRRSNEERRKSVI